MRNINTIFDNTKNHIKKASIKTTSRIHNMIFKAIVTVRNIKIQVRLLGFFLLLSLIPLSITGIAQFSKSSEAMKSKISTYSIEVVNQISKNMQSSLDRLVNDSVDIAISETVQGTLSNYDKIGEFERYDTELTLQNMVVRKFSFIQYVSDVLLYTTNFDKIVAYGDNSMFGFNIERDYLDTLLKTALVKKGAPVWTKINKENEIHLVKRSDISEEERQGIVVCRSINDVTSEYQRGLLSSGKQIGYILIRADEKYISDIYKDINIGNGADIFVIDSNGIIISSINPKVEISKVFEEKSLMSNLKYSQKEGLQSFSFINKGERTLATYSLVKGTDWYVMSTIPYFYLNSESYDLGIFTIFIAIICFFLAALLSVFVSKSISIPLNKLIKAMNTVKKGDLNSIINDTSRDEIAEVSRNYNDLLSDIRLLLKNIENKEQQKRLAQLETLQAQINPHFLSNTLNTVKWLANLQGASNIEDLVTAIIDLLHGSIGKGDELISLREEFHYLKSYISIQEYKYFGKFNMQFEIQDEVLEFKILRFLLQPLVENAIIHGIEPMEGVGLIIIKAYVDDTVLKLKITDNGVGMPKTLIKNILSENRQSSKSKFSGIGLPNVGERIKIFFGEHYGMKIESIPNVFTTLELTLPIMKGEL